MTTFDNLTPCNFQLQREGIRRRSSPRYTESITIGSYNTQKCMRFAQIVKLATQHDILFIQEFKASEENIVAMQETADRAGLKFYSGPAREPQQNTTGIFVKSTHIIVAGEHEIQSKRLHQDHSTDIRVRTSSGDHLLLQNFYLPSSDKNQQAQIINETREGWKQLKRIHPDLVFLFGGDLNKALENPIKTERWARLAIKKLSSESASMDTATLHPTIRSFPTNKGSSNRRIDRLYIPETWGNRATQYKTRRAAAIPSTHYLISVTFLIDNADNIIIGKPRFRYPLQRFSYPFSRVPLRTISRHSSIDRALFLIQSEGIEYMKLMGTIRRKAPMVADQILEFQLEISTSDHIEAANKTFFSNETPRTNVLQTTHRRG